MAPWYAGGDNISYIYCLMGEKEDTNNLVLTNAI